MFRWTPWGSNKKTVNISNSKSCLLRITSPASCCVQLWQHQKYCKDKVLTYTTAPLGGTPVTDLTVCLFIWAVSMWLSCHILSRDILYHFCRINNKRQQLKSPKLNDIDDLHFIRDGILFSIIPLKKTLFYAKIWVIIVLCIVALIVQKCSARSRNREFSLSFISVVNNMLLLKRC